MAKIAVFDSGLGSLSIIKEIQKNSKSNIIYFGDQENFPYGKKSKSDLEEIIQKSIKMLKEEFLPDLIVVGSNTPTIVLKIKDKIDLIGVRPPIREAQKISKTRNIGILGTQSAIQSKELSSYIKKEKNSNIMIHKINGSELVDLVESGKFLTNKSLCSKVINKNLNNVISKKNIDVITLSSTHLPFLKTFLEKQFPDVTFVDPARLIAEKIYKKIENNQERKNSLNIFSSGDLEKFQKILYNLGIKNKVKSLSI